MKKFKPFAPRIYLACYHLGEGLEWALITRELASLQRATQMALLYHDRGFKVKVFKINFKSRGITWL